MAGEALVCPTCASLHPSHERFCPGCGMPLVNAGPDAVAVVSERQERARKIKPQYAEGELVRVAVAQNQIEAEFIRRMLLEEGVPSIVLRPSGFDMLDFVGGGSFGIMVAASGAVTAAEVLGAVRQTRERPERPRSGTSRRVIVGLVLVVLLITVSVYMASYDWPTNTRLIPLR